MRFSDRYGYTDVKMRFQRECADEALRTRLWNTLKIGVWDYMRTRDRSTEKRREGIQTLVSRLWFHHFKFDLDDLPAQFFGEYGRLGVYEVLKAEFMKAEWFDVFNFVEFMLEDQTGLLPIQAREFLNDGLEAENSAYRIVGDRVMEITSEHEIEGIQAGLNDSDGPVQVHLNTALDMLSSRSNPDYRNSIKESISAVEAACRLITNNKSATLGDAIKRIPNLHPVLVLAFSKLYGYTSDESGIRHALSDETLITYADAKFMLVTCAAFISFLKSSATAT